MYRFQVPAECYDKIFFVYLSYFITSVIVCLEVLIAVETAIEHFISIMVAASFLAILTKN